MSYFASLLVSLLPLFDSFFLLLVWTDTVHGRITDKSPWKRRSLSPQNRTIRCAAVSVTLTRADAAVTVRIWMKPATGQMVGEEDNGVKSQVAERWGNRASNQKIASSIPGCVRWRCVLGQGTLYLPWGECPCTYCKSLWVRASAKWLHVK